MFVYSWENCILRPGCGQDVKDLALLSPSCSPGLSAKQNSLIWESLTTIMHILRVLFTSAMRHLFAMSLQRVLGLI